MDRCWLQGALGDALHAISCAAGYNLRWLLRAIARLGIAAALLRALSTVVRKRCFLALRARARVTTDCNSSGLCRYGKSEYLGTVRRERRLEFIPDRPVFMTFLARSDNQIYAVSRNR